MAEMPDVVSTEIIASDWGNDIRDRTAQRYANAAERDALNPAPVEGDIAFLDSNSPDRDRFYVYWSGLWRPMVVSIDGQLLVASGAVTTPTYSFATNAGMGMYAETGTIIGFSASSTSAPLAEMSDVWLRLRGNNSANMPTDVTNNSVGAPAYAFRGDLDTGMYLITDNTIGLAAGGTQVLRAGATSFRAPPVFSNTVTATANVYVQSDGTLRNTTSMRATKDNFAPLAGALDVIRRLLPMNYTSLINDDKDQVFAGFVAEDVTGVIPEAETDKSYDVTAIVAYLVAAVQELAAT